MGVKITSIGQIPTDFESEYFVYLLTSNFPLESDLALRESFEILAKEARGSNFVVIQGLVGEFGGEVMNAYSIDGIDSDELLPAILISSVNPHQFQNAKSIDKNGPFAKGERVVFISLKKLKADKDQVFGILQQVLKDIKAGKSLRDFEYSRNHRTKFLDALIVQPNLSGIGINLKVLWDFLRGK